MTDLFFVVLVLSGLLVVTIFLSFYVINKLVNKVMSKSYFEYLDAEKNLKKPKTEIFMEEGLPQEDLARVF